tara:strand:- start:232 stop:504 length:273 start_codon:yes stop_codon:yes gene_type:complete
MFNSFWKKTVNSRGYHSEDELIEIRDKIKALEAKIQSNQEVIDVFSSLTSPNEKRIKANQSHILKLEREIVVLEEKLKEMEAKNVNRKRA